MEPNVCALYNGRSKSGVELGAVASSDQRGRIRPPGGGEKNFQVLGFMGPLLHALHLIMHLSQWIAKVGKPEVFF